MDIKMTIQEFLESRMATGDYVRQYDLGLKLELNSSMLSKYLKGHVKTPSLEFAQKLFREYGVIIWPYSEEAVSDD